ncbi:acetyl-CoA carboxylase biotin carboxyl carrier protein subunit [Flagellimonas sp. S174]|uniref:acetyl-CoA carboxylase biotin carboxyl carrier protein subunit n=1 Tax=Flagellimonas sp. S174 TaxID=3410790 RepID=UPI003BF57F09
MEESYSIMVNEDHEFELTQDQINALDILKTGYNNFHILKDGKSFHIEIVESNFNDLKYAIKVNGTDYHTSVKTPLLHLIDKMGFASNGAINVASIEAPMPGLILDIAVKEGQEVNENDPLLILEAMKMENSITSPRNGIIKSISVSKGDAVDKKQVLLTFE